MSLSYNILIGILRTLCILEIVAFWHLRNYFSFLGSSEILYHIGIPLTFGALTLFSFISGYLCSYNENNKWEYYKKRIVRIVLPLCVSYYLMIITGYIPKSWFHFLFTLLGLHSFVANPPTTLWYISMTIFFYMITPFLYSSNKHIEMLKMLVAFVVVCYLYKSFWVNVDRRLVICLPFYCTGVLFRHKELLEQRLLMCSLLFMGCLMISFLLNIEDNSAIVVFVKGVGGFFLLYGIGLFVKTYLTVLFPIIKKLAYCSMFAYLFHRPIYYFIVSYVHFSFYVLIPLMVVSLFCISYALQYGYDYLLTISFAKYRHEMNSKK